MEEAVKLGWWARRSTTSKVLIVGSIIGLACLGVYYFTKKDDDSNDESGESNKDSTSTANQTTSNDSNQVSSEKKEIDTTVDNKKENPALPNNGVGCSELITNFDRDFNYVKCNGIWHIISKPNPATPATKGAFKEWSSLEGQKVSIERLNRRYPNA